MEIKPFFKNTGLACRVLCTFFGYIIGTHAVFALELSPVFSDHMVLQRDRPIPIWGKAMPASAITVILDGTTKKTVAGGNGEWRIDFPARTASALPIVIQVSGEQQVLTVSDVLTGDVWLCSGQSNLGVNVSGAKGAAAEIKNADYPQLRLYTIIPAACWLPGERPSWTSTDEKPKWNVCTPQTAANFTAVGYVFGSELFKKTGVPVGVINAAFGGAPIEPFIPREIIKNSGRFPAAQELIKRMEKISDAAQEDLFMQAKKYYAVRKDALESNTSVVAGWQERNFDDTKWKLLAMPGYWQENAKLNIDGSVWFGKTIRLDAAQAQADRLALGYLRMNIRIWVNGKEILTAPEATGLSNPKYAIPPGTIAPGENTIAFRIYSMYGVGGVKKISPEDFSLLQSSKPANVLVDLSGNWKYEVEAGVKQERNPLQNGRTDLKVPGVVWNAMIAPLVPLPVRGVVWYQGESNVSQPEEYAELLPLMINTWRADWKDPHLAFLIVQLPNYAARLHDPSESTWARLRQAQDKALSLPNTAMAVTFDVGDEFDLHPRNKRPVGERLALLAEQMVYGLIKPEQALSPRVLSAVRSGNTVVIRFTPASTLQTMDGQAPREIAVAGTDRKFVWAKAKIKGKTLVIYGDGISSTKYIRYAWANNPDINLVSKAGLLVAPFEIAVTQ
jgi:sialate O-acetylesterase